ncbi:hypothetical protein [Oscillatoria sp. FACHB-1407]|nr:hypothetical protein [Oscillatoria sp. FACHB-1407]
MCTLADGFWGLCTLKRILENGNGGWSDRLADTSSKNYYHNPNTA